MPTNIKIKKTLEKIVNILTNKEDELTFSEQAELVELMVYSIAKTIQDANSRDVALIWLETVFNNTTRNILGFTDKDKY